MSYDPDGELAAYLRAKPIAYSAFRVMHIYDESDSDAMAERNEVPFLSHLLFPVLLSGYVIFRRISRVAKAVLGAVESIDSVEYVFTMTSDHEYKTHSLLAVGERLRSRGENVVLLCSPATDHHRSEWEERGFDTLQFQDLLENVSIDSLFRGLVETTRILAGLRSLYPEGYERAPKSLLVNITFLETVKAAALRGAVDDPIIQTYAPMPYIIEATRRERIFAYQHGMLFAHPEKIAMGYPFFMPLTYFIWGEQWRDKVSSRAHPDSELLAVGSPWHDHLVELGEKNGRDPTWDVLFVSDAHGLDTEEATEMYESVFEALVEECETRDWSLAVKLHPAEDGSWYRNRGWGDYIREFDGILDALLESRVSVTDWSSVLVESSLLGTPTIVTNSVKEVDLEAELASNNLLTTLSEVYFSDPEELGVALNQAREAASGRPTAPTSSVFADGDSVTRIVEILTAFRDPN